jgi:hypothetical protein
MDYYISFALSEVQEINFQLPGNMNITNEFSLIITDYYSQWNVWDESLLSV